MGLVMDLASYNTDKMGYVAFGWWMGVFCRSGQLSGPRWVWRFARTIISDRGASRLCRELPVSLSDFSSAEVESPNMSCRFKGSLGPSTSSVPWGMSTQVSYHSWNRQRWKVCAFIFQRRRLQPFVLIYRLNITVWRRIIQTQDAKGYGFRCSSSWVRF